MEIPPHIFRFHLISSDLSGLASKPKKAPKTAARRGGATITSFGNLAFCGNPILGIKK